MQRKRYIICGNIDCDVPPEYRDTVLCYHTTGEDGHPRKVKLKIGEIRRSLFKEIPERFHDLLEIATYVYCADQELIRGQKNAETFGSYWRRHFHFVIPVRDTAFWQSPEIINHLEQTLGFLSDDRYEFEFVAQTEKPPLLQYYLDINDKGAMFGNPEQIVMFSGGLDSLGGAVDEIINQQRRIVLVNHRSTEKLDKRYRTLESTLESKASDSCKPTHIRVTINKRKEMDKEYTQRSRSFLYVTIGATIAEMLGFDSVRFYENGVISLNLPVCAQVVGGKATRTTHPRVIRGFQTLLSKVADKTYTVENPFIYKTKGEVVELIGKSGCEDLIGLSLSCTHTREITLENPHCGTCSQCIDRRFAVIAAGMEQAEPEKQYKINIFTQCRNSKREAEDKIMFASYLERANQAENVRDCIEFLEIFPETARALNYLDGDPWQAAERIFSLYKRHANEVNSVTQKMMNKHFPEVRQRALPSNCMLRIIYESHLPISVSAKPATQKDLPDNVFRRKGDVWQVRFNSGKDFILLPTKGAEYLCTLLAKPNEKIPIVELVCKAALSRCTHLIDVHDAEEQGMQITKNHPMYSTLGKVTDWKTINECREEASRLLTEIEKAKADNNNVEVEHCQQQISQLLSYTDSAMGIGRIKNAVDKRKNLSDGFRIAIKLVTNKIAEYNPECANHLIETIRCGYNPSYCPKPPILWATQSISDH